MNHQFESELSTVTIHISSK